jgi:hypothetical protein
VTTTYVERWPSALTGRVWSPGFAGTGGQGIIETWTLAGAYLAWPDFPENSGQLMRVYDPQLPQEIIRVLGHVTGSTYRVMRADQGSTPVQHPAGFELTPCLSAESIGALAQGVPSGNGLVLPAANGVLAIQSWTDTARRRLVGLTVPANEAAQGALYQATVFGWVDIGINGGPKNVEFGQTWGPGNGTTIGFNNWTINRGATQGRECRYRLDCWLQIHNGVACASTRLMQQITVDASVWDTNCYLVGPVNTGTGINVTAAADYTVYGIMTGGPAATFYLIGGRAWRAA